jgi:hypothetical protein
VKIPALPETQVATLVTDLQPAKSWSMSRPSSAPKKGQNMSSTDELQNHDASPKWKERFAFFNQHGSPKNPTFSSALKQLTTRKRMLINMNFIAIFFGPVYLFVLGLWKKNLALIAIIVVVSFSLSLIFTILGRELPYALGSGLNVVFALMYGLSANYAYYLKQEKGSQGWNPFEGLKIV